MSDAVTTATYSDMKLVKTRGVMQMILEFPIEQAADIVGMFGIPVPGKETWVAIARLDPKRMNAAPERIEPPKAAQEPEPKPEPEPEKKPEPEPASSTTPEPEAKAAPAVMFDADGIPLPTDDLPMSGEIVTKKKPKRATVCAILCAEAPFREWLHLEFCPTRASISTKERAAEYVRSLFEIESRRELDTNDEAGAGWDLLVNDFREWQRRGATVANSTPVDGWPAAKSVGNY